MCLITIQGHTQTKNKISIVYGVYGICIWYIKYNIYFAVFFETKKMNKNVD